MEEEKKVKKGVSPVLVIILIIIFCAIGGVGGWYLNDYLADKNEQNTEEKENTSTTETTTLTEEEATKTVQELYEKAYETIGEGADITSLEEVEITVGEEGTVGGVNTVKANKIDLSKIESYFTTRAMEYIKEEFTDTPEGYSDGNYYVYAEATESSAQTFMGTIFGVTDQGVRTFEVQAYDNDTIIAISVEKTTTDTTNTTDNTDTDEESVTSGSIDDITNEYIVLEKVDGEWKIDLFE